MEESVQNDTVASVAVFQESPVEEKGKKMGVYVLIVLLVFSLLGLTYFILKDNGVDVLESIVGGTANTEENITEESNVEDGDDTQECTVCSDEVSTDNEGWGLFSLPEYGFSVEVPTYRLLQDLDVQDIYSYWEVKHADYAPQDFERTWYGEMGNTFLENITVSFYPSRVPESVACGQGCVQEHTFDVYIFEKDEGDTWSDVKNQYIAALESYCPADADAGFGDCTQKNSVEKKWNKDVLNTSFVLPGGSSEIYILTNDSYIYLIQYYISPSPSESAQIAQKVLDSMKFE